MCGIAGAVNWGDEAVIQRMTDALSHRGPDDAGVAFFRPERVGLGHRRLSIIDLSPAGHQPMKACDGALWVVFNGETYNFRELRRELEERGHRFESNTDTEVILRLYAQEGPGCVKRLDGMFALAILDRNTQTLLLARDQFGIKPLYYYAGKGRVIFGSEIKSILASGGYTPEVNWQGIHDYFTYSCVPCPETAFREVMQVPPAHTLEIDLRTMRTRLERYWEFAPESMRAATPRGEICQTLRTLLASSVRRQMVGDVPLGAFLSGGVDSPVLVGLMAEMSTKPVKTFTIAFEGRDVDFYDERSAARLVAKKFATEHHEIVANIDDPLEMLRVVGSFDQPFGNPTAYLMYLISKHTRSEVTVALCGAGGDELFAGYPRYRAIRLARLFRHVPGPLLVAMKRLLGMLNDGYRTPTLRRVREFLDGLDRDFTRQFVNWTYYLTEAEKSGLLRQKGQGGLPQSSERVVRRLFEEVAGMTDFGNRVLATDISSFLVDNLLEYTDKMSMAVGLEVRVPYLDREFARYSMTIPFSAKLRAARSKAILRDAFVDLLPDGIRRGTKKGFVPPLAIWMRDRLDNYFDAVLTREAAERDGIFNWDYIQMLRGRHRSGAYDYSYELFCIIMFDAWYRQYVAGHSIFN